MFKKKINENSGWQMSLFQCLEELSDMSKTNDQLSNNMMNYVSDWNAMIFLLENRNEIVADFIRTKKKIEKGANKKKNKGKTLSNVYQKNAMYGEEDEGLTNHQVLAMLGMSKHDILQESSLGLHSKNVKNKALENDGQEFDKDVEEFDYVNIHIENVAATLGATFTKTDFDEYMVYDCKPSPKAPLNISLFKISDLPEHFQTVFGGVPTLNQLQTQVREVCLDTDENMLVCAPTGAGKTNVALLTILRELNKVYDYTLKTAGDFKVVYVSPLKALAAEIVEKFGSKLKPLGVTVREYTGDIGLTKQELQDTHIIVATPEKWDVMTRKSDAITELVKLIIIDEIHLLDEERGRVLECIVARTLMTIERKQSHIRLVGLSATLPNYKDVARFMQVKRGLFYFNESYRPVPLYKKFIGVRKPKWEKKSNENEDDAKKKKQPNKKQRDSREVMNELCFNIVNDNLLQNEQVLVFVHSRKETITTAKFLIEYASITNNSYLFENKESGKLKDNQLVNHELRKTVSKGIGSHNAGLWRKDRKIIENGFLSGKLKVVVTTATLAWGVNLPAHTVIIKGTDIYEAGVGWKDLSILDVQQIFGRAGRPQFDTYGEAILITKIDRINHFMGAMNSNKPIESNFESILMEALNAEIALGNITHLTESYDYVKRTFYYVRCSKNPTKTAKGMYNDADTHIYNQIESKLEYLHKLRMIRYDKNNLFLESTELGRIASHYYINCATMERFCTYLNFYEDTNLEGGQGDRNIDVAGDIEDQNLMAILAQASEFWNLQVREEEMEELKNIKKDEFFEPVHKDFTKLLKKVGNSLTHDQADELKDMGAMKGEDASMNSYEKVMTLIQGFLSLTAYDNYSLVADTHYIVQNGTRILRCIFEI